MLHGSLTMPTNWSVGHRCQGHYCPVPTSQPSVPPPHCCLGSDYPSGLNCTVRDLPHLGAVGSCLASAVGGGFSSLEKKFKPRPLNVTNSTNKPALKGTLFLVGFQER